MLSFRILLGLFVALGFVFSSHAKECYFKGDLTVEVLKIEEMEGDICFALYEREQRGEFPKQEAVSMQVCQGVRGEEDEVLDKVTFEDLCWSSYAVGIFHDLDQDGELDKGSFGQPLEPFGFSNDPKLKRKAPKWSESSFVVNKRKQQIGITLQKFKL